MKKKHLKKIKEILKKDKKQAKIFSYFKGKIAL